MNAEPLVNVMRPRRIAPIEKFAEFLAATHSHSATFYNGIYFHSQEHPVSHMVGDKPHDVFTVFPSYCPEEKAYDYLSLSSMTRDVRLTPKGKKFESDGSDQIIAVFHITEYDIDEIDRIVLNRIKEREEEEKSAEKKEPSTAKA